MGSQQIHRDRIEMLLAHFEFALRIVTLREEPGDVQVSTDPRNAFDSPD